MTAKPDLHDLSNSDLTRLNATVQQIREQVTASELRLTAAVQKTHVELVMWISVTTVAACILLIEAIIVFARY